MIHYHGGPFTPQDQAMRLYRGRHAMVSFANPGDIELVAILCQSFTLDNGAFSFWTGNGEAVDSQKFYEFVVNWMFHPGFDWALIPDVIDGTEEQNDTLLKEWPFGITTGVPVWHLHESLERLERLVDIYPRIALGSSGKYKTPGVQHWWQRVAEFFPIICDKDGFPKAKVHGLRMLDPDIFQYLPFSSVDSTNVARNSWDGPQQGLTKGAKAQLIIDRVEFFNSSSKYDSTKLPAFVGARLF